MQQGSKLYQMVIKENKLLSFFLYFFYRFPFNNKLKAKGKNNHIKAKLSFIKKNRIIIIGGNNTVVIEKGCRLYNCSFIIHGNHNLIRISEFTYANHAEFYIEDDNNEIIVDRHTCFAGKIHLACTEGKKIKIGEDCLFSSDIVVRTGDSHSIIDEVGHRVNFGKNIEIGKHVWVGYHVLINKGVSLMDNCIVGTGAVLTKQYSENNVCIAGNPARIVKQKVNWLHERI